MFKRSRRRTPMTTASSKRKLLKLCTALFAATVFITFQGFGEGLQSQQVMEQNNSSARDNNSPVPSSDPSPKPPSPPPGPDVKVIFDTDMATDVDDAGALAVLHALADNGEVEILGVLHNTGYPYSVGCIDVINTFYGRPDIPIGAYKGSFEKGTTGRYAKKVAIEFPSDIKNHNSVPSAVSVYRKILAKAEDNSVTVVTVGFLINLRDLLASSPDEISPLSGKALVTKTVKHLVVMGGQFPSGKEFNLSARGIGPVAKEALDNWPSSISFTGNEIGNKIPSGRGMSSASRSNPVRRAYEHYYDGKAQNRWSWDQTAVILAVRGLGGENGFPQYWKSVNKGHNKMNSNGSNKWQNLPDADHEYIVRKMSNSQMSGVIEELMLQ